MKTLLLATVVLAFVVGCGGDSGSGDGDDSGKNEHYKMCSDYYDCLNEKWPEMCPEGGERQSFMDSCTNHSDKCFDLCYTALLKEDCGIPVNDMPINSIPGCASPEFTENNCGALFSNEV